VSDPDHERYGDHLSVAQVEELIQPSGDTADLVHEWLEAHGIGRSQMSYTSAGDWITVSLPVEDAESLLQTKYAVYMHDDGTYLVRAPKWSLPEHLHGHIDTIQPTNSFFRPAPRKRLIETVGQMGGPKALPEVESPPQDPSVSKVCNSSAITPTCLRTLYGTLDYKPQVPGKNKVGLTDYLGEANNRSDTKIFLERYRPDAVSAAYQFKVQV
jgi:tripeptidyl-peptidase I